MTGRTQKEKDIHATAHDQAFFPPPRASRVPRPRLIDQIDEGLRAGRRLTLLSAPAGFGKTTLLSDWTERHKGAVAWLSLDEEDDDAPRFWSYLIAAVQTIHGELGHEACQLVQGSPPLAVQAIVTSLINDIAILAGHGQGLALVLDDYHHISSPHVHDGLTFLLEHQSPNVHVILSTRANMDRRGVTGPDRARPVGSTAALASGASRNESECETPSAPVPWMGFELERGGGRG